jgi:hypothetical protein
VPSGTGSSQSANSRSAPPMELHAAIDPTATASGIAANARRQRSA